MNKTRDANDIHREEGAEALRDAFDKKRHVPPPEEPRPPIFSDEALALGFADLHKHDLRYVAGWGRWLVYDGQRWASDETMKAFDLARQTCRAAAAACNNKKLSMILASARTVAAVVSLARADRRLAATVAQWDRDLWLLNTPAGVVDLRTGKIRPHAVGDYMTKITSVAPGGACPLWLKFLARVTGGNSDLETFLQRVCGYALTGSTIEHALFFLYGTGGNGKSKFLEAITGNLGDYHRVAPIETFTASTNERHPTDLAGLRGARLVTAIETEEGRHWAEAKIKALTGGDPITARFMRQDYFDYVPQFKLIVAGNHKPSLRSVDEGIRRRFNLIPFTVTIPEDERDKSLGEQLKNEWPGILQWMIDGGLAWQSGGLAQPAIVRAATDAYLENEDAISSWLEERCYRDGFETTNNLFASWKDWAAKSGEDAGSRKRFREQLESRSFIPHRENYGRGFREIGLKPLNWNY